MKSIDNLNIGFQQMLTFFSSATQNKQVYHQVNGDYNFKKLPIVLLNFIVWFQTLFFYPLFYILEKMDIF